MSQRHQGATLTLMQCDKITYVVCRIEYRYGCGHGMAAIVRYTADGCGAAAAVLLRYPCANAAAVLMWPCTAKFHTRFSPHVLHNCAHRCTFVPSARGRMPAPSRHATQGREVARLQAVQRLSQAAGGRPVSRVHRDIRPASTNS